VNEIFNPFSDQPYTLPYWFSVALTAAWIVGVINAINLLDGMDGLASGVSIIVFGSLTAAYLTLGDWTQLAWIVVVVGAVIGFLRYNFNPAQIFMGDSGSMFLGFLIAAYSLRGATRAGSLLALMIPIIAMGLPIVDTGLAIVRRGLERRHLFHADSDHIHHRVARRMGLSHRGTVLLLYSISVLFGFAAFLLAISDKRVGDSWMAPIVLIVTGFGIFGLLRFLGYLEVPRKGRAARPVAAQGGISTDGRDSSQPQADLATKNGAPAEAGLPVAEPSSD
jgi:UDP-GlcNAc:undecaprenyl-phosphate GlcNAc-1-phosphate transferase